MLPTVLTTTSRSSDAPRVAENNKKFRNLEVLVLGLIREVYGKKGGK